VVLPLGLSLLAIILIGIALAALLVIGLVYLVNSLGATATGAATGTTTPGGPAAPPPAPPYQPQIDALAAELQRVQDLDEVTADDCATLRAKYQAAVDAGAPASQTDPSLAAIDAICPQ